jgi:hypothetical protein
MWVLNGKFGNLKKNKKNIFLVLSFNLEIQSNLKMKAYFFGNDFVKENSCLFNKS